jgi:hypothetical protein
MVTLKMGEGNKATTKGHESKSNHRFKKRQNPEFSPSNSENLPFDQIMFLQKTIGNQSLHGLFKSGAMRANLKNGQREENYDQPINNTAKELLREERAYLKISRIPLIVQRDCAQLMLPGHRLNYGNTWALRVHNAFSDGLLPLITTSQPDWPPAFDLAIEIHDSVRNILDCLEERQRGPRRRRLPPDRHRVLVVLLNEILSGLLSTRVRIYNIMSGRGGTQASVIAAASPLLEIIETLVPPLLRGL